VKAKSYEPKDAPRITTAKWLPYLRDIAFQYHVFGLAYPELHAQSFLMLPDKSRRCTVDGLSGRFLIRRGPRGPEVEVAPDAAERLGDSILTQVDVQQLVEQILARDLSHPGGSGPFAEVVAGWADALQQNLRLSAEVGAHCRDCQFRNDEAIPGLRSGFDECWAQAPGTTPERLARGTVLDVWELNRKKAISGGKLWLDQLSDDDLSKAAGGALLGVGDRQRMQLTGTWPGGGPFFLNRAALRAEMGRWRYPLHFIDFEAAQPVIPVARGMRPYTQLPFQFSMHTMDAGGSIAHAAEFLAPDPAHDPSLAFLRALRDALDGQGTVLMWSTYERTVLRALARRLEEDLAHAPHAAEFSAMIATLCDEGGSREMGDMCALADKLFFHPATKGSSSIKRVLPAVLRESAYLQQRYTQPIYGARGGIESRNFRNQAWYQEEDGQVLDPYKLLGRAFGDLPIGLIEEFVSDEYLEIANGGAAATAWASLQFGRMSDPERHHIRQALLRYCELDTLAMAMIAEAWREWCEG
jgi:hypothetical protein